MKEIIGIEDAKKKIKEMNIIIYGSVRNIENDFVASFSNLDIIASYFNNTYMIIVENDSQDKTRDLLISWSIKKTKKINKHLIFKDKLDTLYPLRAHRIAYCRNLILNYIESKKLNLKYQYAFHCDLDNVFWSVDFESICNCFQYDLQSWDAMTCVNKSRTYYDFWALRCNQSWFNMNIFSCNANNVDYNTKIAGFETLLKNTTGLLPVNSSFNGFGIYKLDSLLCSRYSAEYHCDICKNNNRGCLEDNDHVGLHKQMIHNNCKLFINKKMCVQHKPNNAISYDIFINLIKTNEICSRNPLTNMLINNTIDKNGKWLMIDINNGETANLITNYYSEVFTVFNKDNNQQATFLNKNVSLLQGDYDSIVISYIQSLNNSEYISFIYFNNNDYLTTKQILNLLYFKIKKGTILVFHKLVHFENYQLYALKAFYEFTQEYQINFEWLLMNNTFDKIIDHAKNYTEENQMVAVKILHNTYINDTSKYVNYSSNEYDNFNWIFYTTYYSDLIHIANKEQAYMHWKNHGIYENRICVPIPIPIPIPIAITEIDSYSENIQENSSLQENNTILSLTDQPQESFNWISYLELNRDLKAAGLRTKQHAYNHWINNGKNENRLTNIDWCSYVNNYNLISQGIDTKVKAINHWLDNGKRDINANTMQNYDKELFDWTFYLSKYEDLKHFHSYESAWEHWCLFGKKEGRVSSPFKWSNYLIHNKDLLDNGINTESLAIEHWIKYGRYEKRQI